MAASLCDSEIQAYRDRGILFPIPVLSRDEVAKYRSALDQLLDAFGHRPGAGELGQAHYHFGWALELALHPRILDAVECLLGPDILVWASSFFMKYPRDPAFISWHQDATYWGLDSSKVVSAWIALEDSTIENGCMRVVPGSQTQEIHPHVETHADDNLLSRGQEIAVDVDEKDAQDVILRAGEMSFHHVNIIHGSNPNRSDGMRIGFVVRYMTPDVNQVGDKAPVFLARGEDRFGHFEHAEAPPDVAFEDAFKRHCAFAGSFFESIRKTKGAF